MVRWYVSHSQCVRKSALFRNSTSVTSNADVRVCMPGHSLRGPSRVVGYTARELVASLRWLPESPSTREARAYALGCHRYPPKPCRKSTLPPFSPTASKRRELWFCRPRPRTHRPALRSPAHSSRIEEDSFAMSLSPTATEKLKMLAPSRTTRRRSGRKASNALRLTWAGSAPTWPKSGLMVMASVRSEVSPYFKPNPMAPNV